MSISNGPACGSLEASTYLMAVYYDDSGIRFTDEWYCCHEHVPHSGEVLPPGAKLIEVVVADARYTTIASAGTVHTTRAGIGLTFESAGPGEVLPLIPQTPDVS